ncbi:MAG TPA: VOC family protein [Stenotrophomonas sp.]|jgi:predicted enzyme related to lactoylglutathione lyase
MHVTGIGGLFFRARDPDALQAWYRDHLGVGANPPESWVWQQQAGATVFAPFKHDTDYFPADRPWMLNLRVQDLDGLLGKLRAADIEVVTKAEWDSPETGRFARIHDPEGLPIELWEPPADD